MNVKIFPLLLGVFLLGFATIPAIAAEDAPEPCSEKALPLIQKADLDYKGRDDFRRARNAFLQYELAVSTDPHCVEGLWKGARAAWWAGDGTVDKKEKLYYYERGVDLAKKAIELSPRNAEAHFWLAGNYGSIGETRGVMKSLFMVGPMRKELRSAEEIDPTVESGGPLRVNGIMDYKVPGIAGGNMKRAEESLLKVRAQFPAHPTNYYYLAEYYVTVHKPEKALPYLDDLRNFKLEDESLKPDLVKMQTKGEALRQKIEKK